MNRFKDRVPLLGFAQQVAPIPETALPLLDLATTGNNIWIVTVGFQPAAVDNAAERWLALNTYKINDEWLADEVRIVHFSPAAPKDVRPLKTVFAGELELGSVALVGSVLRGEVIPVELTWHTLATPDVDYNTFIQLLDANGQLVAQHDAPPRGGYAPTSSWQAGAQVTSKHALTLPVDLPPGSYRLIAGLYDPATGHRLMTDIDVDFVDLGTIVVTDEIAAKTLGYRANHR